MSISLSAEKYSPASTPPASGSDGDESEQLHLDLEHLDDVTLPSPISTEPLVAIPEPSPFSPKNNEEAKTDDKFESGRLYSFDKSDTILNGDKSVKPLMIPGSATWSMGYFSELTSGRGDLWRERSIWRQLESTNKEGTRANRDEATKLNENGGHSCGVLFWGW